MLNKLLALLLLVGLSCSMVACETSKGIGRDTQRLGDSIEDTARDLDD